MKPFAESCEYSTKSRKVVKIHFFFMGSKNTLVSNFKYLNLKNVGGRVFPSVVGTNSLVFAKCFYQMFECQ